MKIIILSDIHGNYSAMCKVMPYIQKADAVILLGDLIDYGPHSNEIIKMIHDIKTPIVANILGNHEHAILNEEYAKFSSDRGRVSAKYTRSILNEKSWEYIKNVMNYSGKQKFEIARKKCLAIHGSIEDEYWRAVRPGDDLASYQEYDYVFSGHSHLPHYFEEYYKSSNPAARYKKKTVFVNPGSVGQPRNLCRHAQFALWDVETDEFIMKKVPYDIEKEQEAFSNKVDVFYKERLEAGV